MKPIVAFVLILVTLCSWSQTMDGYRKMASDAPEKEDYTNALLSINKVIEIDRIYIENYISKGFYLISLKRLAQAYETYSFAMSLNPKYSSAYHNRAVLLAMMGEVELAYMAVTLAEDSTRRIICLTNRAMRKAFSATSMASYPTLGKR
jgi:tetratricopeptide (TPR) repeat protein